MSDPAAPIAPAAPASPAAPAAPAAPVAPAAVQPFDLTPALNSLSAENRAIFDRKKWVDGDKFAIDLNGIADSYRGLETKIGAKTLVEPTFDTDENFDKWEGHAKLGVPDSADKYVFDRKSVELPEGVEYDEGAEQKFRAWAHKAKIPQFAFQRLMKEAIADRIAGVVQSVTANKASIQEADTKLRTDWGASYDSHIARSKEAFGYVASELKIPPEDLAVSLNKLAGDPVTLKLFDWLGEKLGEDTIKTGKAAGFATGPDAAKAQLDSLLGNQDFVKSLQDKNHINHASNVETRNRLQRQIHGS